MCLAEKMKTYCGVEYTNVIRELMMNRENFAVFRNGNRLMRSREYDEWCAIYGLSNTTERVMFKQITDKWGHNGYAIKATWKLTTLLVPQKGV